MSPNAGQQSTPQQIFFRLKRSSQPGFLPNGRLSYIFLGRGCRDPRGSCELESDEKTALHVPDRLGMLICKINSEAAV